MRFLLTILLLLVHAPADRGSISGTIVKLKTGESIPFARVLLTRMDGRLSESLATTADENGRFGISNIAAGNYRLFATQDGFVRAELGQRTIEGRGVPLATKAGEDLNGLIVSMIPTSVMAGRVLGSNGEPLRYATVKALKSTYSEGVRILASVLETQTNDLGEYRLHGLVPGTYWIAAAPRVGNQRIENGEIVGWNTALILSQGGFIDPRAFDRNVPITSYYPGVTDLASSVHIDVQPGEVFRANDFILPIGSGLRVRGQTVSSLTNQPVTPDSVSLIRNSNDGNEFIERNSSIDPILSSRAASSSFDFTGIQPGSYVLRARAGNLIARIPVDIRNDMENLQVVLSPAYTVTGRIRMDGKGTLDMSRLSVRLQGTDISPPTTPTGDGVVSVFLVATAQARPQPDGGFTLTSVLPGMYRVVLIGAPPNAYVKTPSMDLRIEESTSEPLDIVVSIASGVLDGKVFDENRKPSSASTVVLVPESARNHFDLFRTAAAGPSGEIHLEGIVPGAYRAFAWEDIEANSWQDPEVIKRYEDRGVEVRIEESGTKEIELRVIR